MTLVHDGKIVGFFEGYSRGSVFMLDNGTLWEQVCDRSEYAYWDSPRCELSWDQSLGRFLLVVAGTSSTVVVRRWEGRGRARPDAF
jgi:hypothetical protein